MSYYPIVDANEISQLEQTISHRIEFVNPVDETKPARAYSLKQTLDANGFPTAYSIFVVTEVCTDNKCKLVKATLHWNALGDFDRIEVLPQSPLTKKEHVPFDEADYDKLNRILRDRNSILSNRSLAYLAKPVPAEKADDEADDASELDAWSGATPATVQAAVVQDAAYTTWVMWHWANGEIVERIVELTEQRCTPDYLKYLLHSGDRRQVDFALTYILEHHPSEEAFVEDIVHVLETSDREHVSIALDYLSKAIEDKTRYHARLIDSLGRMNRLYCPMVLAKLSAEEELPDATLDSLAECLDRLPYFPVHLILRMLEQKKYFSERVETEVVQLLGNDDFFIARRAYEYLKKQDLHAASNDKLEAFADKYQDRL